MSRFLGPIHTWLFNKIKLYEDLEMKITNEVEQIDKEYKNEILKFYDKIGEPIENKPLEDLIDTDNIHGWLQNRIVIAETRQAAIITSIINEYKDKGLEIIKNAYADQAKECGLDAQNKYDIESAPQLYKALNNYILDGMPCDNVNNITANEENRVQWKVSSCLHKGYWENVDGDLNNLYELRRIWIENFIKSANSEFNYKFEIQNVNSNKVLIHEISK